MPVDYSRYPPDWKERRARILERAGNRCEHCGARAGEDSRIVYRDGEAEVVPTPDVSGILEYASRAVGKVYEIRLGIAHLDHDEANWDVRDDRLAALCMKCHFAYDADEHQRRRAEKKYRDSMFPIG